MIDIKPYMHSLGQLKDSFRESEIEILETQGWYFITSSFDRWTLLDGVCYLNGNAISKKELQEYIKNPPEAKKRSLLKMIRAKDYFEQEVYDDSYSDEVSV